ncbi:MAG TPA: S9 family peptidase [Longimicrobiales bacterium]|nr:S9 family peptidase [Longimicrobiales bacterium]
MRTASVGLLLVALASVPVAAQEQAGRSFTPQDWYRLTTVSDPAMSPDGRLVAFTVTTVKEAENERHSEVWVVPSEGGEPVRYTSPGVSSSSPRWSHDGTHLFFSSARPGGRTWALRMDRPSGEAFQLEYQTGSRPRDGSFVVFAEGLEEDEDDRDGESEDDEDEQDGDDDPFARMTATARPPFGSITEPVAPRRFDGRHIVDIGYKRNGRGFVPNRREARTYDPAQIWIQHDGDTARVQLTSTAYSHESVTVSPDGRWIAFVADAQMRSDSVVQAVRDSISLLPFSRERDEEIRNDSDIFIMPVSGGAPQRVTNAPGDEGDVAWSPDSRRISYVSSRRRTEPDRLYVIDRRGGEPHNLLGQWQYEPGDYNWTPDGEILLSAAIGGRTALFRVSPDDGEMTELIGGRRRLNGFTYDEDFDRVAYVATSVDRPTELFIADANGRNETQLTSFNEELNREIAWTDAERFTYESVDGFEIEAWLQKPYGYEPGRKYPLVLYIHGGPHSSYGEGWFDEFHNIAGAGMWVLYTNPRGSSGYGADFTYSTRGRWGMEDYEDLMKAVDIVARRPDVDPTRMGVTGGSYGGFMTAWITTKTNRFKAAQTDRMISNWWSWYGSSDAQGLTEFEFYGKPWESQALYDELSPIRYVGNVRTPTLIVQSEEDHRTPMADAEQWFTALRKQDVPVEFIRYPRSTHDLSRTGEPWLLVDRLGRLRQWFLHWLGPVEETSVDAGAEG